MYKWGTDQSSTTAGVVEEITFSDSVDLEYPYKAIWCSAEGTIKFKALNGADVTGFPVHVGANRIGVKRIYDTGTDAITIWGLNS